MAVKTILTAQEDFTGEFPAERAASGLWRFNEAAPDGNDRLADSSGNGRDFTVVHWSGTSPTLPARNPACGQSMTVRFLHDLGRGSLWEAG